MKKILSILFITVLALGSSMPTFGASVVNKTPENKVARRYSILSQEDIDNNIVNHDIIEMDDGFYYESILTLDDECVTEYNGLTREFFGYADKTYTHKVTGYYLGGGTTDVNTFKVDLSYKYHSGYPGYSDNAVTYIYCSKVSGTGIAYDAGRSQNVGWVTYKDPANIVNIKYTYTVSWGNLYIS